MATKMPSSPTTRLRPLAKARTASPMPLRGALAEPFCIESMRSPAAYCLGCLLPPNRRRYHGTAAAATTFVSTMLAPHRRQNLRLGSLGSLQAPQMRSPGCATRSGTLATALGFGVVATSWGLRDWMPSSTTSGVRAAGWAAARCGRGRRGGCRDGADGTRLLRSDRRDRGRRGLDRRRGRRRGRDRRGTCDDRGGRRGRGRGRGGGLAPAGDGAGRGSGGSRGCRCRRRGRRRGRDRRDSGSLRACGTRGTGRPCRSTGGADGGSGGQRRRELLGGAALAGLRGGRRGRDHRLLGLGLEGEDALGLRSGGFGRGRLGRFGGCSSDPGSGDAGRGGG